MAVEWTKDLHTGIEVIDHQHRRIVDFINRLELAIEQNQSELVGTVLADLVDYSQSHFVFEESLHTKIGYSLSAAHKSIHDVFIKRLQKYRERHDAGEDIARQLHGMLSTWLIHHIKRDDMSYVPEVKSRMITLAKERKDEGWLARQLHKVFGSAH